MEQASLANIASGLDLCISACGTVMDCRINISHKYLLADMFYLSIPPRSLVFLPFCFARNRRRVTNFVSSGMWSVSSRGFFDSGTFCK